MTAPAVMALYVNVPHFPFSLNCHKTANFLRYELQIFGDTNIILMLMYTSIFFQASAVQMSVSSIAVDDLEQFKITL